MSNESYTIEEVAQLLKVSKLTVYDLVKKGELASYRVGRQMRVDQVDLQQYKDRGKGLKAAKVFKTEHVEEQKQQTTTNSTRTIIISGQDVSLDILANKIEENNKNFRPLRSYVGSLDSLISMYKGEADIVSMHLLDGDTDEYNVPYARKILVNQPIIIINLTSRSAGFYVQKGNPKKISSWNDFKREDVKIINREVGSGARVLLDEKLRLNKISPGEVNGYTNVKTSHLSVAGSIANNEAHIGVGIEKVAKTVGIDFIPIIKERYDLIILKKKENEQLIKTILRTLSSEQFKNQLNSLGGYDVTLTGEVIYESEV